jgi:serine/threonine protein kinase
MELLKGMPLSDYLKREGPLAPEVAVELLLAACAALAHVHAGGLLHGDVKSANLFLLEPDDFASSVRYGWRPRIKLMDFGLAQCLETALAPPASLDGTPAYMPPEQLQGRPLDARSDLYSLGVVACEALTGRLPFAMDGEGSPPAIPAALARLVASMLAPSRADRPASADELAALLRALRQGREEGALPTAAMPRLPEPPLEVEAESWQGFFREAKINLAAGRGTEGQVLLIQCLAALGEALRPLSEEDRESYCRDHAEIAAALELNRRLSLGRGART